MEIPMAKDIRIPGEIENKEAATVQKWFVVGGLGAGDKEKIQRRGWHL